MGTFIIGVIFLGVMAWAFINARHDMKNNKCGSCSGNCSVKNKCSSYKG